MTTPYKPMIYHSTRFPHPEVLCLDKYHNYDFLIVNMGTHPTAYVRIPKTHPFYQTFYDYINPEPVGFEAGPFTFSRNSSEFASYLDTPIPNGWYLGWDYAHIGDFIGGHSDRYPYSSGRKYTTENIIADCKYIINYLLENKNVTRSEEKTNSNL